MNESQVKFVFMELTRNLFVLSLMFANSAFADRDLLECLSMAVNVHGFSQSHASETCKLGRETMECVAYAMDVHSYNYDHALETCKLGRKTMECVAFVMVVDGLNYENALASCKN